MTANVKTVQDSGDTAALLFLDGDPKGIWTPDRELARTLLGKPIPSDWLVKPNKQGTGNIALPPKKGGGGGGYRQSKEAFESEAKSRAAWQAIEEEKKDRRTALMQAATIADANDPGGLIVIAELFYDWLRETSGLVAGESPNPPVEKTALDPGPDTTPAPSVGAGTPAGDGEAPAGREPGEESPAIGTSPGPTKGYPLAPEKCDHRARGGYWLKTQVVDGQARCPRCGLSAVMYRESA